MVMMIINYEEQNRSFTFDWDVLSKCEWQQYRTSDRDGENLKLVGNVSNGMEITILARSIVTLTANRQNSSTN